MGVTNGTIGYKGVKGRIYTTTSYDGLGSLAIWNVMGQWVCWKAAGGVGDSGSRGRFAALPGCGIARQPYEDGADK